MTEFNRWTEEYLPNVKWPDDYSDMEQERLCQAASDAFAAAERVSASEKPSWDTTEWELAITCAAETIASFRNPDNPPPPTEHDQLEAGHIIGAILGRDLVKLRGFVPVASD